MSLTEAIEILNQFFERKCDAHMKGDGPALLEAKAIGDCIEALQRAEIDKINQEQISYRKINENE